MPDKFWNGTEADFGGFRSEFDELSQFKADADAAKAALPKDADSYVVGLPEGFEIPEGLGYEFDSEDPRIGPARAWAHKHGVSQAALTELLGVQAQYDIDTLKGHAGFAQEQIGLLGPQGPQRLEAVMATLKNILPAKNAEALKNDPRFATADGVVALELLVKRAQGGTPGAPTPPNPKPAPTESLHGADALRRGLVREVRS